MSTEQLLSSWTGPSSDTEQDKQDRTERMVREAIDAHEPFENCSLSVYAKGSYANNTNVKADSDVDIAVQCTDCCYWEEESDGAHPASTPYLGEWTPTKLRSELVDALKAKFPNQVDTSGSTAIQVNASSSRVDADVVPCFSYEYHFDAGSVREGTKVFPKSGASFKNFPAQQLENGRKKNNDTNLRFKKAVRILKRVENAMVSDGYHREVPSFFVECLVYNVPNSILNRSTWVAIVKGIISHVWEELQGDDEPSNASDRWLEVNKCKYLFHSSQKWSRKDGRDFAKAAWNNLDFGS